MPVLAEMTDEDLMELYYQESNEAQAQQAFAELDRRHRRRMTLALLVPGIHPRFVKLPAMPGQDQKAEELVGEALFKVARTRHKPSARWTRSRSRFRPWLYGVLRNVALSYLRRRVVPVKTDADLGRPGQSLSPLEARPAHGPSPEEELQRHGLRRLVRESLGELPDELRQICELVFDQGLKQTEVARRLRLTTPTLTRRKQEACRALRRILERKGIGEEMLV